MQFFAYISGIIIFIDFVAFLSDHSFFNQEKVKQWSLPNYLLNFYRQLLKSAKPNGFWRTSLVLFWVAAKYSINILSLYWAVYLLWLTFKASGKMYEPNLIRLFISGYCAAFLVQIIFYTRYWLKLKLKHNSSE